MLVTLIIQFSGLATGRSSSPLAADGEGLSPIYQRRSASNPHPEHGISLYLSGDLEITRPKLHTFETRSELRAGLAGGLPITPRRVLIPGSAPEHRTTPIAGSNRFHLCGSLLDDLMGGLR